ncbi:hypothetical protein I4U23_018175 [Adineta vaga]|nr:hypothetical protein I4U23_018175 [Adineta vaga]
MEIKGRIFPLSIMGLVLLFSIIHLGVSIGIIGSFRKYGDFFRPQIGLCGFNIAISIFGLVTSIVGAFSIMTDSPKIGKVVFGLAGAVGIMAIASLVTAIIINAKSLGFVSTRFMSSMNAYASDSDAQDRIDMFQTKYECCGSHTWLDWANVKLVAPSNTTTTTVTTTTTGTMTSTTTTTTTTTTTAAAAVKNAKRNVDAVSNNFHQQDSVSLTNLVRQKRQTVGTYGDIYGLPLSYGVTFPYSCCTSEATTVSDATITYCVSNQNNAVNHFYTDGCLKSLDTIAGNQAMGFGIINSFLAVLAFVAMPIVWNSSTTFV